MKAIFSFILPIFISSSGFAKDSFYFECGHTEPNWGLQVRGNQIHYTAPDKEIAAIEIIETKIKNRIIYLKGKTPDNQLIDFQIEKSANYRCEDGKSIEPSTHWITFTLDTIAYSGCCSPMIEK